MGLCQGHQVPDGFTLSFHVCFEIDTPAIDVQTWKGIEDKQYSELQLASDVVHTEQVKIIYVVQIK